MENINIFDQMAGKYSFETNDYVVYKGKEYRIDIVGTEYIQLSCKNYKVQDDETVLMGGERVSLPKSLFVSEIKAGKIRKLPTNEIFINENYSFFIGEKINCYENPEDEEYLDFIIKKYLREKNDDDIIVLGDADGKNIDISMPKADFLETIRSGKVIKASDLTKASVDIEKKEEPKKESINKEQYLAIIDETKEKFVAQEDVVELIGVHIFNNLKLNETKDPYYIKSQKSNILLDGSTGTGKTAIVNELASKFEIPIYKSEITNFTSTGFYGRELTELLVGLLKAAGGDLEKAQQGIIILDEFDKVANKKTNLNGQNLNVQNELLPYLDGSKIMINFEGKKMYFDTSKVTFICVGAFTTLRNKGLGILDKADYESFGLNKELLGRLNTLLSTKTYEFEDYKNILLNSTISPYKAFKQFCEMYDVPIILFPGFIDVVCEEACDLNLGVRGLNEIFSRLRNYCISDLLRQKSKMILLSKELISDSKKYGR